MEYIVDEPLLIEDRVKFVFKNTNSDSKKISIEITKNDSLINFVNLMYGTFENNDIFVYYGKIYNLKDIIIKLGHDYTV